jgi:hypothetical protein
MTLKFSYPYVFAVECPLLLDLSAKNRQGICPMTIFGSETITSLGLSIGLVFTGSSAMLVTLACKDTCVREPLWWMSERALVHRMHTARRKL